MKIEKVIAIVLAVAVFAGLGAYALSAGITSIETDVAEESQPEIETVEQEEQEQPELSFTTDLPFDLDLENLAPLDGAVYEGWIVKGDDKISFGTFNTNTFGQVLGNLVSSEPVADGDEVVITIEPQPDPDPGPSGIVILAGAITDNEAELAFPIDVSTFSGKYILATPSDGDGSNEDAGIWFVDLTNGLSAGLDIPVAPEGWIYEGWVVIEGVPYSTGKFADPATADDFNGYSGPQPTPAYPGEDFLVNLPAGLEAPYNLNNGRVSAVISIEPYINGVDPTGSGPAQVKPLSVTIPLDLKDHETQDMELSLESIPSGSATVTSSEAPSTLPQQ